MYDLTFTGRIDTAILSAELRAAFGTKVIGVSTAGDAIRVHIDDNTSSSDDEQVTAIVITHQQRYAAGYYRLWPAFQAQSRAFIQAYRARMTQRTAHFKQAIQAIK